MNKIWRSCVSNFRKWTRNPRIFITFFLFYCHVFDVISPFNKAAEILETSNTPWFFPFFSSNSFSGMYILLGFVLLFCDAPFIDKHQPYIIIRIGKLKWLLGQFLYIVIASFLFLLSLQFFIILALLPKISFTTEWGSLLYTISQTSVEGFLPIVGVSFSVIETYSAIEATLLSFLIVWLEGIFIGSLLFFLNIQFKRIIGTSVGCFYAISFFMIKMTFQNNPILWKISPCVWMDIVTLAGRETGKHPGAVNAIVGLLLIIIFLLIGSARKMKTELIEVVKQI